jgi:RHS repeat-associated protein
MLVSEHTNTSHRGATWPCARGRRATWLRALAWALLSLGLVWGTPAAAHWATDNDLRIAFADTLLADLGELLHDTRRDVDDNRYRSRLRGRAFAARAHLITARLMLSRIAKAKAHQGAGHRHFGLHFNIQALERQVRRQLKRARWQLGRYNRVLTEGHNRGHIPTGVFTSLGNQADALIVGIGQLITGQLGNIAPIADAGPDRSLTLGQAASLDGTGSSDADGDTLTYQWTLIAQPGGSTASLLNDTQPIATLTPGVVGEYVVQLIVDDGQDASAPDQTTVRIDVGNTEPNADAGPDQAVQIGAQVILDGSASSDTDGDPLTYQWSLSQTPPASAATLGDATIVRPSFTADQSGEYRAELTVDDGQASSAPDEIIINVATPNTAPVAQAGPDQSVFAGDVTQLDASGSSDVDGDPLNYTWSLIAAPSGSQAALDDPASLQPSFVADEEGAYVAQLVVDDGTDLSASDTVTVNAANPNTAPVTEAGADQSAALGAQVTLDGSASNDADGDPLTYQWSLLSKPAGSGAALSDATIVNPTLTLDVAGEYVAQLMVDDGTVTSGPDTVILTTINSRPVADAGVDQSLPVSTTAQLDGSASSDADGDLRTYQWSVLSQPTDSQSTLIGDTTDMPSLLLDAIGLYVVQLIVDDGELASTPVTITLQSNPDAPLALTVTVPTDGDAVNDPTPTVNGNVNHSATVTVNGQAASVAADLTFSAPVILTEGANVLTVVATDALNVSQTVVINVELDTQLPVLTWFIPTDGSATNQTIVGVTGNVDESATLTINGAPILVDALLDFAGTTTLTEGLNTLTLVATDVAGNTTSETRAVILDATPPTITVTAPTDGALVNNASVLFSGAVNEPSTLTINGQAVAVNVAGQFSDAVTLVEGVNAVSIVATDAVGNVSTQAINVNVDTTAPALNVTTPTNDAVTNQTVVSVAGTLNEAATLLLNGTPVTVAGDLGFNATASLIEGANILALTATDAAGNPTVVVRTVTLDTVTPAITVTAPAGGLLVNNPAVTFAGSVSEPVTLTVNGQVITVDAQGAFDEAVTLAEGATAVAIIATDAAGNAATQTVNITVDSLPPAPPSLANIARSNPTANGVVSVAGNANAAEPGASVRIINPRNGYTVDVVAAADGSFNAQLPAFANDIFQLTATDSAGNQSATSNLGPVNPVELTLDAIGDRTAPLGTITSFTVTVADTSGEPIELGLTPVPLPSGMSYDVVSGEFSFAPKLEHVGVHTLTFSAQTGDERITETINVTVPAPTPGAPTSMSGRVLDANAMAQGQVVPMVGTTVSFIGTGISTTTDVDGYFTLNNLPPAADVFDIDGTTTQPGPGGVSYASFREKFVLEANVNNLVKRPFYMPRIDATSLTTVNPNATTVVQNSTLGVSLTIPAGAAINSADGSPYTGQISISEVPLAFAPAAMPKELVPSLLITIQPVGVEYTVPAPITFANDVSGFDPGNQVDIWSVDPDLGQFVVVGTGEVSTDGATLDTVSGGIRANDWHLWMRRPAAGSNTRNPKNPCIPCPSKPANSMFSLNDGHMWTTVRLPQYRSLERSRSVSLQYSTARAYPYPVVATNWAVLGADGSPQGLSYDITIGGLKQGPQIHTDTAALAGGTGIDTATISLTFNAEDFAPGSYDVGVTGYANNFDSGRVLVRGLEISRQVLIENGVNSHYGRGWMIGGLHSLALNTNGTRTLIAPTTQSVTYSPGAVPDTYDAPNNDYATLVRETDGTYTHTSKRGIRMRFDAQGLLTERIDRHGNRDTYAYDAQGKLLTLTDPVGLVTTFTYGANDRLTSITDPAGRRSDITIDTAGNLGRVTYPDGAFETYDYDARGLMVEHLDERGNRYTERYDVFGRAIDATLPDGTVRQVAAQATAALIDVSTGIGTINNPAPVTVAGTAIAQYTDGRGNPRQSQLDLHGRATMSVDELGRVTEHVRDANSNATQTTRPIGSMVNRTFDNLGNVLTRTEQFNGATTTYSYDAFSLVTSVTNPRNNATTLTRDPVTGDVLQTVNALGHTSTMQYDNRGLVTQSTMPNGLVTTSTYNALGLIETRTQTPPVGSPGNVRTWQYSYFPTGLTSQVTTPDGITLNYTYNDRSQVTTVTDNLGQQVLYTYDANQNLVGTETRNTDGSTALLSTSNYDLRNRLVDTRAPHGNAESITQQTLDENSNLTGSVDPNGNGSTVTYDAFNRTESTTHREGGITQYEYDLNDRVTKVIAPNGATTAYENDPIGRRIKEISPDRGTLDYTFDLANNVTSVTDARGITAIMVYDQLERATSKTYPNTIAGKNENVSYTYDACAFGLGALCARTDESGGYAYRYDAFGNTTQQVFTEAQGTMFTTDYVYDDGDNVIQMTYPSGRVVTYQRDGVRRISGIDAVINGQTESIVSNIQYRGDNQMQVCTFGNGTHDQRTYDLQGRLVTQDLRDSGGTILDTRTYSHDANSNILGIDTNVEDNAYEYDKLDRLTGDGIDANPVVQFTYDLNDNRLTRNSDASTNETYEHSPVTNRLTRRVTTVTGVTPEDIANRTYTYNNANRQFRLSEEGQVRADYIYNDQGQRTRKTLYDAAGNVTETFIYHHDLNGRLVAETNPAAVPIKDYLWSSGYTAVAQIDHSLGLDEVAYLHVDHLMTARLATDTSENVGWRWEGLAFGGTGAQTLGGVDVALRFPGQYFDTESGEHYNYFRYYDPSTGRYKRSDPIGLIGDTNTYWYASAAPVKETDFRGLRPANPLNSYRQHQRGVYTGKYHSKESAADYNVLKGGDGSPLKPLGRKDGAGDYPGLAPNPRGETSGAGLACGIGRLLMGGIPICPPRIECVAWECLDKSAHRICPGEPLEYRAGPFISSMSWNPKDDPDCRCIRAIWKDW